MREALEIMCSPEYNVTGVLVANKNKAGTVACTIPKSCDGKIVQTTFLDQGKFFGYLSQVSVFVCICSCVVFGSVLTFEFNQLGKMGISATNMRCQSTSKHASFVNEHPVTYEQKHPRWMEVSETRRNW